MAWRCKLVAKQNLGNKIKKGDVITFPVQTNNSAAITLEMMGNAIANFIGGIRLEKSANICSTFPI